MKLDNGKIITIEMCREFWEPEMYLLTAPLVLGAQKYDRDNWLKPEGGTMRDRDNVASIGRHLSEHSVGMDIVPDADVPPLICVANRAMMSVVRQMRGIAHPLDAPRIVKWYYQK